MPIRRFPPPARRGRPESADHPVLVAASDQVVLAIDSLEQDLRPPARESLNETAGKPVQPVLVGATSVSVNEPPGAAGSA